MIGIAFLQHYLNFVICICAGQVGQYFLADAGMSAADQFMMLYLDIAKPKSGWLFENPFTNPFSVFADGFQ